MVKSRISVRKSTPIAEAIQIMADNHLLNLPRRREWKGYLFRPRHDLLRASVGMPVDIEE